MEELLENVTSKVREIFKYNPELREVVDHTAQVYVSENKDGKFEIDYLKFCFYDDVVTVSKTEIEHHLEYGVKTLFKYNGWDELLDL